MKIYVCFSQEQDALDTITTYRGTCTELGPCIKFLGPTYKFDPRSCRQIRPEDSKIYYIIPDGDNKFLLIFEEDLTHVVVKSEMDSDAWKKFLHEKVGVETRKLVEVKPEPKEPKLSADDGKGGTMKIEFE